MGRREEGRGGEGDEGKDSTIAIHLSSNRVHDDMERKPTSGESLESSVNRKGTREGDVKEEEGRFRKRDSIGVKAERPETCGTD